MNQVEPHLVSQLKYIIVRYTRNLNLSLQPEALFVGECSQMDIDRYLRVRNGVGFIQAFGGSTERTREAGCSK